MHFKIRAYVKPFPFSIQRKPQQKPGARFLGARLPTDLIFWTNHQSDVEISSFAAKANLASKIRVDLSGQAKDTSQLSLYLSLYTLVGILTFMEVTRIERGVGDGCKWVQGSGDNEVELKSFLVLYLNTCDTYADTHKGVLASSLLSSCFTPRSCVGCILKVKQ